jgi:hypothetical protein
MGNVYLVKKNGKVIAHTDLQAMKELEGVEKPDMTITSAEWDAAEGLARIIGNKIVLGKTAAEKEDDEKQAKIAKYKAELAAIDREAGAGRAIRGLALAAADKAGVKGEDYDRLKDFETNADSVRDKLDKLL